MSICIYIYELWNVHGRYSKYRSLTRVYNTKELEDVKNNITQMASLLEQLLASAAWKKDI
jgi:hypothetical protein